MRVYTPQGTKLLEATPQTIPEAWMILNRKVVPRVDVLDEGLPGLASFGTLLVVPGGGTVTTSMRFSVPAAAGVAQNPDGSFAYKLNIRKQPGTSAVPITIRVRLPAGATLVSQSPQGIWDGQSVVFVTNLKLDLHLEVVFRRP